MCVCESVNGDAMKSTSKLKQDCEKVNQQLREEAAKLRLGTKASRDRLERSKSDNQVFSYWATLEFREFCRRMIEGRGSANANGLIADGARLLGLSPVTTKRYLSTLRASGGPLAGLGEIVILNAHYSPIEEDGYWLEEEGGKAEGGRQKAEGGGRDG